MSFVIGVVAGRAHQSNGSRRVLIVTVQDRYRTRVRRQQPPGRPTGHHPNRRGPSFRELGHCRQAARALLRHDHRVTQKRRLAQVHAAVRTKAATVRGSTVQGSKSRACRSSIPATIESIQTKYLPSTGRVYAYDRFQFYNITYIRLQLHIYNIL